MPETFERPVMVLGPPPVAPWNSRVNYAYVGPRGKIQVLQKGQDCFRAKVLRRPSVDLGRMELSLQSTDGQARRAFAAITPRTGLWQEGQEITVNLRLSPQAEPSTAFCACDSLEVADNAPLASISATPRTTAKLAQCHIEGAGTRPQIVIDGKPHAPIYYLLSGGFAVSPESKEWMFQAAARTGCNILRLGAKFEDLWRSENEFDFSSLDRKLDAIALTAPNAYLILNIQTGMPEWWCKKYPDDVTAYYGDHPRHRQKDRQALASKRYLQDADKALTAIIAHLKRSFLASRVIGLAISEGWNSEWFWSYVDDQGRSAMAGFSPSDHATFRSYLHEEYGTDAALAKAWNMPGVTMATAPMPPPERIKAGSVGLLLAPGQDMQVIDWFRFRNRSLGEAITYLCGVVKRESNNSWLAGAYYGYLVAFSNIFGRLQTVGHLDIERVARSPHVDFLTAPSYYTWRYSGEGDGIMQAAESFTAHGKLVIVEQDLRTHNETSNHEIRNGMLSTPDQSVGAIQRAVALTMTRGVGTHWLEMYENWFYEPLLQEVMGDAKRAYEELAPVQALTPIEVTILSDTQSAFYTKHNLGDGLHAASIGEMQRRFAEAAIPFRHVLLRDVLETGRIPPARFYIVNNLLTLSPEDRAALMKRFQDERATVLWLYAAGLNLPNRGPDTKLMGEFLGVTFQMDNTVRQPKLTLEADLGEATALNFNRSAPWFLPISGYQRTLGKDEQGRPALVKWTKDGVTHIFSTLMNLPPQVIRTLAMDAGVHSYSGTGDPVLVGNDVVALHAKGSHQTSSHASHPRPRSGRLPIRRAIPRALWSNLRFPGVQEGLALVHPRVEGAEDLAVVNGGDGLVAIQVIQPFHALVEVARSNAVGHGQGGLNEGGQMVAAANDLAVNGLAFGAVVVPPQFLEGQSRNNFAFDQGAVGELVIGVVLDLRVPARRKQGLHPVFHLLLLVLLDDFVQPLDGHLHRRGDVPRQHLRQVVEERAKKTVDQPRLPHPCLAQRQIGEQRHYQHVPQHGGGGDAGRLAPALLEAQLSAKVNEGGGFASQRQFLHTEQVIVVFDLVLDFLADALDSVDERTEFVEDIELPLGGQKMRRLQDTLLMRRIAGLQQMPTHPLRDIPRNGGGQWLQMPEHPFIQFPPLLGHHAMEDRRLDVGQHNSVKHLKESALDEFEPVNAARADLILRLGQDVCDHHLVRLLVQFREIHRIDLVIPPPDAGGVVNHQQQFTIQGVRHGLFSIFSRLLPIGQSFSKEVRQTRIADTPLGGGNVIMHPQKGDLAGIRVIKHRAGPPVAITGLTDRADPHHHHALPGQFRITQEINHRHPAGAMMHEDRHMAMPVEAELLRLEQDLHGRRALPHDIHPGRIGLTGGVRHHEIAGLEHHRQSAQPILLVITQNPPGPFNGHIRLGTDAPGIVFARLHRIGVVVSPRGGNPPFPKQINACPRRTAIADHIPATEDLFDRQAVKGIQGRRQRIHVAVYVTHYSNQHEMTFNRLITIVNMVYYNLFTMVRKREPCKERKITFQSYR